MRRLIERNALTKLVLAVCTLLSVSTLRGEEPFRPSPDNQFPPLEEAKAYRGELVFVDHINRRGSLRLHVDGHYHEGQLHHFAMLPYGEIFYRGAPADLRDIPIGTVLYGRFYLPPDPKTSAVPNANGNNVTAPRENHAILLEDGPSLCLREGKAWKLKEVNFRGGEGELVASLERPEGGDGLGGEHKFTIDSSTRIWRGRELLGLNDLVADGTWPTNGSKQLDGQAVQLALGWHPRYLYQQFHVADIWLDEAAMKVATERQRGVHIHHIHTRWMPARVETINYGKFGHATVTATLFGGMDESLYADFKPGISAKMAAAENTLRTWWQDHDGMDGKIVAVEKIEENPPLGSSGIQIQFEVPLILEGFRPGRVARIRPQNWPNVKPPMEECVRNQDDRWPSPEIFQKR
ncbi:hypothetical protein LOC68_05360 [Blastopirellula sp. JC732]|uniref:Uncharacterized protein n=1 Tax=Blastopirellula sediminis TaxID=2894196 RepID=A0A9X1MK98_9BACT|nr:hypothetical protein [Blastopirellula sediminis]MCC9609408.1 hypothetical protein [Blastopirellula sediminis]MCC9627815.1 hypothetical protein [Blastopirellula sediminis]